MHIYTGSFPHVTSEGLGRRWEERREGGLGTEDPLVSLGSNSSCILKVQPTGFADGLDVGHERKTGVQDNSRGKGKAEVGRLREEEHLILDLFGVRCLLEKLAEMSSRQLVKM